MALITCPECGRGRVSDTAEACPACGYGIKAHFEKPRKEEEERLLEEQRKKAEELKRQEAEEEKRRPDEIARQKAGGAMNARDVAENNRPEATADPALEGEEGRPAKNIGAKIRGLALAILICGILTGGVWLLVSLKNEEPVVASVSILVSSIVAYFPLYGFGVLVENSEEARKKNNEMIKLLNEIKNGLHKKEAE